MKQQLTIEQLAERMNRTVWSKGDLKRIYLNGVGYNTKKMSTKAYIYQAQDGIFKVWLKIECPSQHSSWITSQEDKVREGEETLKMCVKIATILFKTKQAAMLRVKGKCRHISTTFIAVNTILKKKQSNL